MMMMPEIFTRKKGKRGAYLAPISWIHILWYSEMGLYSPDTLLIEKSGHVVREMFAFPFNSERISWTNRVPLLGFVCAGAASAGTGTERIVFVCMPSLVPL